MIIVSTTIKMEVRAEDGYGFTWLDRIRVRWWLFKAFIWYSMDEYKKGRIIQDVEYVVTIRYNEK